MAEPRGSSRNAESGDRVLLALIELARSAARIDREALDRRAKMAVVEGGRRSAA